MDDQIDDLLEYDAEKAPSSQINHMQLDSNGEPDSTAGKSELFKAQFPQARIKTIMKSDPLVNNVTLDGVYAVAVATVHHTLPRRCFSSCSSVTHINIHCMKIAKLFPTRIFAVRSAMCMNSSF